MSTLERTIAVAAGANAGRVDKAGAPDILHPLRLVPAARTEAERILAALHDVVEDGPLSLEDLRREGLSEEVVRAVDALTRRAGEAYAAFVRRVARDPLARQVKRRDLLDDMDLSRLPRPRAEDVARHALPAGSPHPRRGRRRRSRIGRPSRHSAASGSSAGPASAKRSRSCRRRSR